MKRVGNLMQQIADPDNLRLAYYKAQKGKRHRHEVERYSVDLDENLDRLRRQFLAGSVEVGNYRVFKVFDPKEREICAAPFAQRVMHHALMNVCHSCFDRQLINNVCSSRLGKGAYVAIDYARRAMLRYEYVAKLDVRKYYDTIDHDVLKGQLRRLFKDQKLLGIFESIIDSYHTGLNCGLPIGNLISQYFANHYLSPLDHYAKEVLRVPFYVRYMDDILLMDNDKEHLIACINDLYEMASSRLKLTIKPPQLGKSSQYMPYLGYRIKRHSIVLGGRAKRRYRHRIALYERLMKEGTWSESEYRIHLQALTAFTEHAYSKQYRAQVLNKVESCKALTG